MKILIFGKDGQLGRAYQALAKSHLEHEWVFLGRDQVDLSNPNLVMGYLEEERPQVVINAAAYTAVDRAQEEVDAAMAINASAPQTMARYCARYHAHLLHYSTDYVFDGSKEGWYIESDTTNPLGAYGQSKLAGEERIAQEFAKASPDCCYWILRTSWVYGEGNNFIRTMLRLASERSALRVINDQYGVPTSADFLAQLGFQVALSASSASNCVSSGIYHCVPSGQTTWHGLASAAITKAHLLGMTLACPVDAIEAIPADQYPLPAPRPQNSKMDTGKLRKALGLDVLEPWQESVDRYVEHQVFGQMKSQLL